MSRPRLTSLRATCWWYWSSSRTAAVDRPHAAVPDEGGQAVRRRSAARPAPRSASRSSSRGLTGDGMLDEGRPGLVREQRLDLGAQFTVAAAGPPQQSFALGRRPLGRRQEDLFDLPPARLIHVVTGRR